MKPAERRLIAKAIRGLNFDLREKGRLLAAVPRGRILRGVYLEDSSDPNRVYAWVFVQPLYVPSPTVAFNLGRRLGGPSRTWSVSESDALAVAVKDEGRAFFGPQASPESLADWDLLMGCSDPYAMEARAYSLVASGRFVEGAEALRELAGSLLSGTPWMREIEARAERLAGLAVNEPGAAQELLNEWEAETAATLHVQDLS
jgi:hypothetical protein